MKDKPSLLRLGTVMLVVIAANSSLCAQSHADLIKLSKDSLVSLASAIVQADGPSFDETSYDKISVWSIDQNVWVYFNQSIEFIPPTGKSFYETKVNLTKRTWTASPQGYGSIDLFKPTFFKPNEEQQDKIANVMRSLSLTSDHLSRLKKDGNIRIQEAADDYEVSLSEGREYFINYKVRKSTGEVYDRKETRISVHFTESPRSRIY